jgi:predicted transcriptional regulator
MKERISKFLRILKIELEDLEEDISTLAELTEERRQQHAITEYVSMENISLLRQEFSGIKAVVDRLDNMQLDTSQSFQEFVDSLKRQIKEVIISSAYPDAVNIFIERKIQKVADYFEHNVV